MEKEVKISNYCPICGEHANDCLDIRGMNLKRNFYFWLRCPNWHEWKYEIEHTTEKVLRLAFARDMDAVDIEWYKMIDKENIEEK